MWEYVAKRFITVIPIILGTTFIVFMIMHHLSPCPTTAPLSGPESPEAAHQWREMHGLNDPALIQYARYITGVFMGDFGRSFRNHAHITPTVMQYFPYTLRLMLVSLLASLALALPIGILTAIKKNTWTDNILKYVALIGLSIPVFWLGLLLVVFFSLNLEWLPSSGANYWSSIILPGVTLSIGMMAVIARVTHSSVLEAGGQDYIRVARSKGLSEGKVFYKHILRSALIPVLSAFRMNLGAFFTGIVIVETVFAWPGIGWLFIRGILGRDYPMTIACITMFVLCYFAINFFVDIVKALIDPRVRMQMRESEFVV